MSWMRIAAKLLRTENHHDKKMDVQDIKDLEELYQEIKNTLYIQHNKCGGHKNERS